MNTKQPRDGLETRAAIYHERCRELAEQCDTVRDMAARLGGIVRGSASAVTAESAEHYSRTVVGYAPTLTKATAALLTLIYHHLSASRGLTDATE